MHTAVPRKARTFIVETWQPQANLSLFLVLLEITVFVLPVKTERIALYGNRGVLTDLDIRGCDCLGPKALAGGCNLRCTAGIGNAADSMAEAELCDSDLG